MSVKFNISYDLRSHLTITSFTSPSNLTSSGILGGDTFALIRYYAYRDSSQSYDYSWKTEENDSHPAWHAFDSSSSTFTYVGAYAEKHGFLYIYNPNSFNIESISIRNSCSTYGLRSFYLQYSDDNETYTTLEYFNYGNTAPSSWNINVTPYEGYHKYYRWEIDRGSRDGVSYSNVQMSNIVLRGTQLVEV